MSVASKPGILLMSVDKKISIPSSLIQRGVPLKKKKRNVNRSSQAIWGLPPKLGATICSLPKEDTTGDFQSAEVPFKQTDKGNIDSFDLLQVIANTSSDNEAFFKHLVDTNSTEIVPKIDKTADIQTSESVQTAVNDNIGFFGQ